MTRGTVGAVCVLNNSQEGYTSDRSGAIATHIAETRWAARRRGVHVALLTRDVLGEALDDDPRTTVRPAEPALPRLLGRAADKGARLRGWRSFSSYLYFRACRQALRSLPSLPAHLVLHNDPDIAEGLAAALPEARVTHVFHNVLPQHRPPSGQVRHMAVSAWLAREVAQRLGTEVAVLPNGVDSQRFHPRSGPENSPLTVSFLGRTGYEKGLDLMLESLHALRSQGMQFGILVIGSNTWGALVEDDYQGLLAAQVARLKALGVDVVQTGHANRDDVARLLATSDVHVVPSRWEEPACLALTEAMASGLVVVAASSGGMPEYGADACLWFPRDDVDALVAQLQRVLTGERERAELRHRARARAEQLSWNETWRVLAEHLALPPGPAT